MLPDKFKEIWGVDFEYRQPDGERPVIRCMVAIEYRTGRTIRSWADELGPAPPFSIGSDTLIIAYFASAEMFCFKMLGWQPPVNLLDLYVEFKRKYNGLFLKAGKGLNGALIQHGLQPIANKESMRELAMREGNIYTPQERHNLLNYCQADVDALTRLLPRMEKSIDWPRALLRSRYMTAVAFMEYNGIPIDVPILEELKQNWGKIQERLIRKIDRDYGVYEGTTFKSARFEAWLTKNNIPWPRLPSGALELKGDVFREVAKGHPKLQPLKELRHSLSELRLNRLAVGADGRNRCLLSPFAAKTSRNLPSNAKFIFGPSTWLRGLIKPPPGYGLAYIDWSQQEFAIAAVLSGDEAMQNAYRSGDPYLEFAKLAGAVPPDGTKKTHAAERELFKACVLGVQYGMGPESLAQRITQPPIKARELIQMHKETFPGYWKWADGVITYATTTRALHSKMGWSIGLNGKANPRALANWPTQTNGAEVMRIAVILAVEADIKVCCPVHDALLIEAPADRLAAHTVKTQQIMQRAGEIVLDGFKLRTDVYKISYPERYMDIRGAKMWKEVMGLLDDISGPDNSSKGRRTISVRVGDNFGRGRGTIQVPPSSLLV
jgi:DNA polymerase-1